MDPNMTTTVPTVQRDTTSPNVSLWLSHISSVTGKSQPKLSTLTIRQKPSEVYDAVLEYAFLCQFPDDNPLKLNQLSENVPLFISSEDPFEPLGLDPFDENDDSSLSSHERMMRRTFQEDGMVYNKERPPPLPKFKLGFGVSPVVWPPPECLEGTYLSKLGAKHENKYYDSRLINSSPRPLSDGDSTNPFGMNIQAVGRELKPTVDNTIYVMHYTVGNPISIYTSGGLKLYSEIQLVTAAAEGSVLLRKFVVDILQWRIDKNKRDVNERAFTLYKFMTDRCGDGWWENEGLKRSRPPSSIVLPDGQMEIILDDVEKFLHPSTRRWYIKHGLPHRRSYLFYGPPGTGKTSTIRSIASKFSLNCCFLSMTNKDFSNQLLGIAVAKLPRNALLILEDVDALFNIERKSEGNDNLTFSGLLNALDGVISSDRTVTIMTTNFLDRLDKALIRGGRVDRKFEFAHPSEAVLEQLFLNFYPSASGELARKFSSRVCEYSGENEKSIASLQQLFVAHREDGAEVCVESVKRFFDEISKHEESPNGV